MSSHPLPPSRFDRRAVLRSSIVAAGAAVLGPASRARAGAPPDRPDESRFRFAVKHGMVAGDAPLSEKFRLLKSIGFDGIELDSPNSFDPAQVVAARDETGLRVHGVVDSIHWRTRLSDPDPAVRGEAIAGLKRAIRDAYSYGGSSVLLVPGRVADPERENHEQVWTRSIEGIRAALPLAADLGVHILIENVWNGFCYDPAGSDDQTAELLRDYVDEISSPWVGVYFDLGNHRKYGRVEDWIRTLGRRIVKLDVKDWGRNSGWSRIGDGDVDWPRVRSALDEIGFTGWCTAEVAGGGEERLREIHARMKKALVG